MLLVDIIISYIRAGDGVSFRWHELARTRPIGGLVAGLCGLAAERCAVYVCWSGFARCDENLR